MSEQINRVTCNKNISTLNQYRRYSHKHSHKYRFIDLTLKGLKEGANLAPCKIQTNITFSILLPCDILL